MSLLDILQGASNSVASNVSAPVDGLAWLLRKLGAPVPANPVGGSDWMAQKGLTRDPQNRNAGLLGEFLGMTGPMVAAAKAPQVAKGLLQMGDNAMAPRTMNPQTGAVVWHGSPHKFDAFDSSKIGSGEGAQAYGHGLYLAENPGVAGQYQKTISADGFLVGDKVFDPAKEITHKNVKFWAQKGDLEGALMTAERIAASDSPVAHMAKSDLLRLQEIQAAGGISRNPGALYKVDLPDEHIAKMLDWDKPLSGQSVNASPFAAAQKASLESLPSSFGKTDIPLDVARDMASGKTGAQLYDMLKTMHGADKASQIMREAGIPGIRYLDGGSRGAGTGSSNFVVFPGNEGLLNILERNGQKLK